MPAKKPANKTCFVIGPIGAEDTKTRRHADMLLGGVIEPVFQGEGAPAYKVKRADQDPNPGMITGSIIHDILKAELAIADLTDLNPNVLYELGIRHSAEMPVIHVAAKGTNLPFDNYDHRVIFVDLGDWKSIVASRESIAKSIRAIETEGFEVTNPITQANASFNPPNSADSTYQVLSDMAARLRAVERRFEAGGLAAKFGDRLPTLGESIIGSGSPGAESGAFSHTPHSAFGIAELNEIQSKARERAFLASRGGKMDDDSDNNE